MIGDDWLTATDDAGNQRLADPLDWVHLEIVAALERGVLTIPVLVEGTRMPRPDELPSPLANLALRNAVELRDRTWPQDVGWLIRALPAPLAPSPDTTIPESADWPARFTDSWFAANVPAMDAARLRGLRAELYKRSWNDNEIASRVMIHLPSKVNPHGAPSRTVTTPSAFPSRFTDSWFALNVPSMDADRIRELISLLHSRNWNDAEIAERVLTHAHPGVATGKTARGPLPSQGSLPSAIDTTVVTGKVDRDDPVARATIEAAEDLARMALDPTAKIRERQLADALASHLPRAVVERKLRVPGWDPQPGNIDVFTLDRLGRPDLIIETKLKEGDQVFECLWDMAKALSLATERNVDAAYLVTGSTVASWTRPVACAELFETGRHDLAGAIAGRYRELWVKYILGDSRGRPRAVPDQMDVALVADVRYPVRGVEWQLKAIRVSTPPEARWIPFAHGLPVEG